MHAISNFCHELFPISKGTDITYSNFSIYEKKVMKQLEEIEKLIEEITKGENYTKDFAWLNIMYMHTRGRLLIRKGEYGEGVSLISKMIKHSIAEDKHDYLLKGYKQMIFYYIQIHEILLMKKYVDLAFEIAQSDEIGVLLRLRGLNLIMAGEYQMAEKTLKKSIQLLGSKSYGRCGVTVNIAAATYYIGEIKREEKRFQEAMRYYEKAIDMCKKSNAFSTLAIVYTSEGQVAFERGNFKQAKIYFDKASNYYNHFNIIWKRSIAEGYRALLYAMDDELEKARAILASVEKHSENISNPREIALFSEIKAKIETIAENAKY